MSKTAVILAGGRGTRLKPYTVTFPKPLMPIGDRPILEIVIRQLKQAGFNRIILAVNHQADLIQAYFGAGEKLGVKIEYSLEPQPLGTMGPLKLMKDLPDQFLIMNGDILSSLNYESFFDEHQKSKSVFTISSFLRKDQSQYGVLTVDSSHHLVGFQEKPFISVEVSMGIYAASKEILEVIPSQGPYGFDHLVHDLMKKGRNPRVKKFDGHWLDIGIPEDYERATDFFLKNTRDFLKD